MIEEMKVEREDEGPRGRYVIRLPGGDEAELTYGRRDEATRVADHTFVPRAFRGKGIADMLMRALVADARNEGFKIVPVCSYVDAQLQRNRDWADLRA